MTRRAYWAYAILALMLLVGLFEAWWASRVHAIPKWVDSLPFGVLAGMSSTVLAFLSWLGAKQTLNRHALRVFRKAYIPAGLSILALAVDTWLAARIHPTERLTFLCEPKSTELIIKNQDFKVRCGESAYVPPRTELLAIAEGYRQYRTTDVLDAAHNNTSELFIRLETQEEWICTIRRLQAWDPTAADQADLQQRIGVPAEAAGWARCQQYALNVVGKRTDGKPPQGAGAALFVESTNRSVGVRFYSDDMGRCEPTIPNPRETKAREYHKLLVHDGCAFRKDGETIITGARVEACGTSSTGPLDGLLLSIQPPETRDPLIINCTEFKG